MQSRLNSFQITMHEWSDVHPYNAVHVTRLAGAPDVARLRQGIAGLLEARGLSGFSVDRRSRSFAYRGGPPRCDVLEVSAATDPEAALQREVLRQLNLPFPSGAEFSPFRFFVVPAHGGFQLGLTYHHPVADAESVVHLMRELVGCYDGRIVVPAPGRLELHPPVRDRVFWSQRGLFLNWLRSLPGYARDLRHSSRPRFAVNDFQNGFTLFTLESDPLRALVSAGKRLGVTVNDLLLALLMKGVAPLAASRATARRRRKISLGTIVNTRRDLGLESRQTFGLFLGSFVVSHEVPDGMRLADLARDLCRRTRHIKRDRLYLATPLQLAFGRLMLRFFSTERQRKFYQKYYPLWGGITNMNVDSMVENPAVDRPLDYFRAVSTGPATPLVLSATTVRGRMNVGVSFRTTVFSTAQIESLKQGFLEGLRELEAGA